jgi:hypothetical protein
MNGTNRNSNPRLPNLSIGALKRRAAKAGLGHKDLQGQIRGLARRSPPKQRRQFMKLARAMSKGLNLLKTLFGSVPPSQYTAIGQAQIDSLVFFIHGVMKFIHRFLSSSPPPRVDTYKAYFFSEVMLKSKKPPSATNTQGLFDLFNVTRRKTKLVASYTLANPNSRIQSCKSNIQLMAT